MIVPHSNGTKETDAFVCRREAWDKKYVEVEDEVLFHLILAANFLDIKDLLDLTCKTVRTNFIFLVVCLPASCLAVVYCLAVFFWFLMAGRKRQEVLLILNVGHLMGPADS